MTLVMRVDSRRVLALGLAGLVPAALVTLLLVHQPSINDRRLYPMLRGSLALAGLVLALATVVTWATAPQRTSRASLSGLAWAGVAAIVCVGPFLESTPRARLYALDLDSGEVMWATGKAGAAPVLVDGDLVVTDVDSQQLIGLNPRSGRERWRRPLNGDAPDQLVARAKAAGAFVPPSEDAPAPSTTSPPDLEDGTRLVADGRGLHGAPPGGERWLVPLAHEQVLAVTGTDHIAYAYVATPGASGVPGGAIVKIDATDGDVVWRVALPDSVAVVDVEPTMGANDHAVVVAGGELVALLAADTGDLEWTQNVVTLGKSRGYALPGSVQRVRLTDDFVYLSTTPGG